ncbi:MAG: hypothetical protein KIT66_08365 [Chitinophagaceae bacterium]|nr:hypothetical protein [Chitinophagaceae bacterium]MCZ2395286.1 hypothetical protein [Chitinophagales bacterium]
MKTFATSLKDAFETGDVEGVRGFIGENKNSQEQVNAELFNNENKIVSTLKKYLEPKQQTSIKSIYNSVSNSSRA